LAAAVAAVRGGQLVVLPTDSAYGVGCDAFSSHAVARVCEAKRRSPGMPVPVLVSSWAALDGVVLAVAGIARDLVEAFWPGGLSLVLTHAPSLAWDLGDTRGTVTVRMPLHPFALGVVG
jgi:L-threonylcarbamoyladenylate synthase